MNKFISVTILLLCCSFCTIAQQKIDEEKVNKAVALMMKIMKSPSEAMAIQAEISALKLNSEENKEMTSRMQKAATKMISQGKEQAAKMGGISEADIKKTMAEKDRIVPVKDAARINAVLKRTLAENEIKKFCKAVHEAVKKQLDANLITQAESFYKKIKAETSSPAAMGNGAISCYLTNLTKQAIYIMGRVCSEENADATTLNNYAALLTNHGVEEGAIPLLNYLRRKYPKDPVVLSNIAMAWLGLGDVKTAGKYADTCIQMFPAYAHQAHYVKSVEEESNGNRQGAVVELQKSAGQIFSAVKESQLRKWGGKLSSSNHKKHLPADALGLSKFVFPALPKTYEAYIGSSEEWKVYYSELNAEIKKMEEKGRLLTKAENENSKATAAQMMQKASSRPGYYFAAYNNTNLSWWNYFNEITLEFAFKDEEYKNEMKNIMHAADSLNDLMEKTIKEKDTYECGEGQQCPEKEICNIHLSAYNTYMSAVNKMLEDYHISYMNFKRKSINELVYAAKYCLEDIPYESYKNLKQLEFLKSLRNITYRTPGFTPMFGGFGPACLSAKSNPFTKKGLARFEDIHCPPDWKLEIATGTSVSTHCTKITLTLGFGAGEASYTEDLLTGEWTNMSLEIGKEIGSKNIKGIDVSVEAGAYVEIDRQGITDWGVKGSVGADAIGVVESGSGEIGEGGGGVLQAGGEVKISMMCGKPSFDTKAGLNNAATEISKSFK